MAITSTGAASDTITALRGVDSVSRVNVTPDEQQRPPEDGDRFSTPSVTDVNATEQQALDALRQGLSDASATGEVALAGARSVSDTLDEIGSRLEALTDGNLSTERRTELAAEIEQLVGQGLETVDRSSFNGRNLLDAASDQDLEVAADRDGGTATVRDQDIRSALEGLQGRDLATPGAAQTALDGVFADARTTVDNALTTLTEDTRQIDERLGEIQDRQNELAGADADVDTGLDANGAQLIAGQVEQALGNQALGITNQRPETLIGLFR